MKSNALEYLKLTLLPPPRGGGCVFAGVCLFVRLFVSKISFEQILMTFSGNVDNGTRNRLFNFGDVLDYHLAPGMF